MALINCLECSNEISNKAKACPHCGMELAELAPKLEKSFAPIVGVYSKNKDEIKNYVGGFSLGFMTTNSAHSGIKLKLVSDVYGMAENEEKKSAADGLEYSPLNATITPSKKGVFVMLSKFLQDDQYIGVKNVDVKEIVIEQAVNQTEEEKKSVIGRAIAGGILLGPLGAMVGGMSGVGTKTKMIYENESRIYINSHDTTLAILTYQNKLSKKVLPFMKSIAQSNLRIVS